MARKSLFVRYDKILISLLFVLFGVIALVLGYQAVKSDTEQRTKAAETHTVYRAWEFNGKTAEGWVAESPNKAVVKNGALVVTMTKGKFPVLRNDEVSTHFSKGLKTVSLSLAVGAVQAPTTTRTPDGCPTPPECSTGRLIELPAGSRCPVYRCGIAATTGSVGYANPGSGGQGAGSSGSCTMDARICPDGSSVGRVPPRCNFAPCPTTSPTKKRSFSASLYYQKTDKSEFEKAIDFTGTANDSFETYSVALPDIDEIDVSKIRIVFTSGIKNGESVSVDRIRLLGPVVPTATGTLRATPTPIFCEGPDGSSCELEACPTCPPGRMCPAIACRLQTGTCIQNRCVLRSRPSTTPMPWGCHYERRPCFTTPCEAILVCQSPLPD